MLVAKQKGYFEAMCLSVAIVAGKSIADNYPRVGTNQAQFATGDSFTEAVQHNAANPSAAVDVVAVDGKTPLDVLVVKAGAAATVAALKGATIGVDRAMPASVAMMLQSAGLAESTDFHVAPLANTDATKNAALHDIAAFAASKSDAPGDLDRAGVAYTLLDPSTSNVPGTFGVTYTNAVFVRDHPSAAQDFMRAAMQGLADAIADPAAAAMIAVDFIDNGGSSASAITPDRETYRWQTEAKLITASTPKGEAVGMPDATVLHDEMNCDAMVGMYAGAPPDIAGDFDPSVLAAVYGADNRVIWPAK